MRTFARDVGGDTVRGAANGAVIGGIAGDAGKGAVAGGHQARDNLAIETYYRVYSVDYDKDGFLYDARLHGFFAGLAYSF